MLFDTPITDENAVERLSEMLMVCADMFGRFPEVCADIRAWENLLVYAPIEVLHFIISLKEKTNDPA